jgi:Tfp pilus assembly protein PilV
MRAPRGGLLSGEAGISLIEIVMALSILTVVLVSLGGVMFQVARYTQHSADATNRSAAIASTVAWAQALPWDSIYGAAGCATDTTGTVSYVRCTTIQTVSSQLRTIDVVVTPATGRADTVEVRRCKSRLPYSPLKVR